MRINKIHIINYKNFEKIEVHEIDDHVNIFIGVNGAGKTAILDALAVAAGSYLSKIDKATAKPISREDARLIATEVGSTIDVQPQYPVAIRAKGTIDNNRLEWARGLNGELNKTTVKEAKEIISVGAEYQDMIRNGDHELILPMISYYDTSRLHRKKAEWNKTLAGKSSRLDGYIDALTSGTNEKQLFKWLKKMTLLKLESESDIPELTAVLKATEKFYESGNQNIKNVNIRFSVKDDEPIVKYVNIGDNSIIELPLHLLSDGTRIAITMVADIAHRMAKLNPHLFERVMETPGIILIDEIDMHLHPSWQTKIIDSLTRVFPNIQFFLTTHSPIIISHTRGKNLFVLDKISGVIEPLTYSYGKGANSILREIMGVEERPIPILEKIKNINDYIDQQNLVRATELIDQLTQILGETDQEVVKVKTSVDLEKLFVIND